MMYKDNQWNNKDIAKPNGDGYSKQDSLPATYADDPCDDQASLKPNEDQRSVKGVEEDG